MTVSRSRLPVLLASMGLLAVTTAGCGGFTVTGGEAEDIATATAAPPAAGACLEGAEDCQDTGGDMGAPPPDAPVSDGGGTDGGGLGPDAGQATEVEATDGLDDVHPVDWETVEVDPADQTQVTVYWWSGVAPCNALADVEVDYSDDAVTLTVLEGSVPADEPQACIELAQYKSTSVTLDEEIGPRSILDGAEG